MTHIISIGHQYGRPFGFREMKRAQKKVSSGEWIETGRSKWSVRGPKGGLIHGMDVVFKEK